MNAVVDSIARAFETIGLHPVLGAFIAGAVIAYVFARRSSRDAAAPGAHGLQTHSAAPSVAFKSIVSNTEDISLTVNGRNINLPRDVMNLIRAGNKIDAIKVLRAAAGVDLKTAKELVDQLAASPAAR